jgi:hypothetical protein
VKTGNSVALVSAALAFGVILLFVFSSPIAESSSGSIIQGLFGYVLCPAVMFLLLGAAVVGIKRSLGLKKYVIKLKVIHRFDSEHRKYLD